jgi:hypothetical protein
LLIVGLKQFVQPFHRFLVSFLNHIRKTAVASS